MCIRDSARSSGDPFNVSCKYVFPSANLKLQNLRIKPSRYNLPRHSIEFDNGVIKQVSDKYTWNPIAVPYCLSARNFLSEIKKNSDRIMMEASVARRNLRSRSAKFTALKIRGVANPFQPHKQEKFLLVCGMRIKKVRKRTSTKKLKCSTLPSSVIRPLSTQLLT
eukprot:TRINITY_DN3733_c0_g3_i1.p1 TRINITY_DN3733_c0_g3~~TRINITY_DN3733_c0_g3_i1.p1  ORF type:complete len:165 (+),score=16.67 TRINITY_DN3733_c0_g3_i1:85-579(+)